MLDRTAGLLRCPRTGAPLTLDASARDADRTTYGTLTSAAGTYPVLDGIPYFLDGAEDLVDLVRSGEHERALCAAVARSLPPTRGRRSVDALSAFPGAARLGRVVERIVRRREIDLVEGHVRPAGAGEPLDLLRYGHQVRTGGAPDAFDYFAFRYSMPRHLVALGAIGGAVGHGGAVLDLGCGAGHLSWSLGEQPTELEVVGVDPSFFQLWVARTDLRPRADVVCADATRLPFGPDTFDAVLSSDVLSFVSDKLTIVSEAARVARPEATLAFTALKNSSAHHAYPGLPLPADHWEALATGMEHRLLPDAVVLACYLGGSSAPADEPVDPGLLASCRTYTLFATRQGELPTSQPFEGWPHGYGRLAVNPLFVRSSAVAGGHRYQRRFPSPFYLDDNREMADYLPEEVTVPDHGLDRSSPEVAELIASLAVIGLPQGYESVRRAS